MFADKNVLFVVKYWHYVVKNSTLPAHAIRTFQSLIKGLMILA